MASFLRERGLGMALRGFSLGLGVAVMAMSVSCGGDTPSAPTSLAAGPSAPAGGGPGASVSQVQIAGEVPSPGQIVLLTAALVAPGGVSQDITRTAVWSSSDPRVALVVQGRMTAVGSGEVDITASRDGVSGTRHFSIRPSGPAVDRIRLQLEPGVPESSRIGVLTAAQIAQDYFLSAVGRQVLGETTIIFTSQPSPFALGQSVVSNGPQHTITFYPPGWNLQGTSLIHAMVHEMFHILQAEVNWPGQGGAPGLGADLAGVRWLVEGAADYMAARALSARGYYNLDSRRRDAQRSVCSSALPPLRDLEELNAFYSAPNSYALAWLGTEILTGGELMRLNSYWGAAWGMSWQDAFIPAFGMSLSEFYTRSEQERAKAC